MLDSFTAYLILHKATVLVSLGVFYVLAAGTQPPLNSITSWKIYCKTWAYNLFQAGAANFSARFHPVFPSQPDKGK